MDYSLLTLFGVILLYVVILYYIFIIKRYRDFLSQGRASIFILLFLIVPVIIVVLYNQSNAESRLAQTGFKPYPGISRSVGVLTGTGKNPLWLFSIDDDIDTVSIIKYYKNPENHKGWRLISKSTNMLLFQKDNMKMSISIANKYISYTIVRLK